MPPKVAKVTRDQERAAESFRVGSLIAGRSLALRCLVGLLLVSGCVPAGTVEDSAEGFGTAPVIKIGLIAPFEGLGRPLGYAVLPAVQEALREVEDAGVRGELPGYRVALVALNDDMHGPTAIAQAEALAQHDDLVGAIGLWSDEVAVSAAPVLSAAGIPAAVAVPTAEGVPGIYSLCPPLPQVAAVLVEQARRIAEGPIILAGVPGSLADSVRAAGGFAESFREGPAAGGAQWVDCVRATIPSGAQDDPEDLPAAGAASSTPALQCADPCAGQPTCRTTVLYTGDAAAAADDLIRWRTRGWQGALLGGPELARPWLVGRAGKAAEGVSAVVCSSPGEASHLADETQVGDLSLDSESRLARMGTQALLRAIARDAAAHGVPTRSGVRDELSRETLGGSLAWLHVSDGRWVAGEDPVSPPTGKGEAPPTGKGEAPPTGKGVPFEGEQSP